MTFIFCALCGGIGFSPGTGRGWYYASDKYGPGVAVIHHRGNRGGVAISPRSGELAEKRHKDGVAITANPTPPVKRKNTGPVPE